LSSLSPSQPVRDCFRKNAVSVGIRYRDAKDIQVFPCNPTADAKNGALFNRKSIDSSGRVVCCPDA
jgi:hypothetical protein